MSRMMMNIKGLSSLMIPRIFFTSRLKSKLNYVKNLSDNELESIKNRLNYYNKIDNFFNLLR